MSGIEVLLQVMTIGDTVMTTYLGDLSDADLLVRPTPEANHFAWQLGHLIKSEKEMVNSVLPNAAYPEFPAGFDKQHDKETAGTDQGFLTKSEYVDLYSKVRATTRTAISSLTDADLDKPNTGAMAEWFPTMGGMLAVAVDHPMMHAGQVAVVRRKLGKPIVM